MLIAVQRKLHNSHQASLPSGTRGCSWLCYSAASFWDSQRSLCPKGLAGSAYAIKLRLFDATELRVFVGWRIS